MIRVPFIAMFLAVPAQAALVTSTYVGPIAGNWNVAGHWSPAVVPNNGGGTTFDVIVAGPATVSMDLSATIDTLSIGSGASINVPSGFDPTLAAGPLVNDGLFQLNGGGSELRLGADIAFTGSGQVKLAALSGNSIVTDGQPRRLTNDSNHVIRGAGDIGSGNLLLLTNHGLIEATGPSLVLNLGDNLPDNFNLGTIRASSGTLTIFDSDLTNTGGTIVAANGAVVRFSYGMLEGGELVAEGTGQFQVYQSREHLFRDISIAGLFRVLGGVTADFRGTILNEGTITLDGGGSLCTIRVNFGPQLLGSGIIEGLGTNGRIFGGPMQSTHGPEHTIRGGLRLGTSGARVAMLNYGLIEATAPTVPLQVWTSEEPGEFRNLGVMRANGGVLFLLRGLLDNDRGEIVALPGQTIQCAGMSITGGTVRAEDDALIQAVPGYPTRFTDLSLAGFVRVEDGAELQLSGEILHEGTLELLSGPNFGSLRVFGLAELSGGGTLLLGGPLALVRGGTSQAVLVNGAAHAIRGGGKLGDNGQFGQIDIVNHGQIVADGTTAMSVEVGSTFENHGSVRVPAGGSLVAAPGAWTSTGSISVELGGAMTRSGDLVQAAGETVVDGELDFVDGVLRLQDGELRGTGTILGDLLATGGSVRPSGLLVAESYVQGSGAGFAAELGVAPVGTDPAPLLEVGSTASLNGTLQILVPEGVQPKSGDAFTLIQAASCSGTFATVESPLPVRIEYTEDSVRVVFLGPPVPGDLNSDGLVNQADLAILLEAWGICSDQPCPADLNDDGIVDGADLGLLLRDWRRSLAGAARTLR